MISGCAPVPRPCYVCTSYGFQLYYHKLKSAIYKFVNNYLLLYLFAMSHFVGLLAMASECPAPAPTSLLPAFEIVHRVWTLVSFPDHKFYVHSNQISKLLPCLAIILCTINTSWNYLSIAGYLWLGGVATYAWGYLPIVSLTLFIKVWTENGYSWLLRSHPHLGCRKNNNFISVPLSVTPYIGKV